MRKTVHSALFDPLVARWFDERFREPTPPQAMGWQHIAAGEDTLIAAPTGSGKTLAAFLWAINRLLMKGSSLRDETSVLYVSPLKSLGNDVQKNLQEPLSEIRRLAEAARVGFPEVRVLVRTGDTPAHERQQMVRCPPHILITTPESLYILLTAERSRRMLSSTETVIVDEIHAVAGEKRGAHLALSLERLDALTGRRVQRVGLSATQNPIVEIAHLLVGGRHGPEASRCPCAIVDVGHRRALELAIEVPDQVLGPIATHELYADVYERMAAHARAHRSTIVFVNTRRLVERVAHQLELRLGEGKVAAHHGSLSRRTRLLAEDGLKTGTIPVVVATASLELGIDVGHVDLVCHLGAPRAIATLLQRVGRSGHWRGAVSQGILFPLTRDDLVQCAAAVRAVRAGVLDRTVIPRNPLDILAQQIVATVASAALSEEEMWQLVRRAYPFRDLPRQDFEAVLTVLSEGVSTRRGRRSALVHRDRVHGQLRPRRGARLIAITGGGAIPDTADYDVVEDPAGTFVGKVNEDFAVESMAGDIFLLGNHSWRIRRVEAGRMRVEDAGGAPPTIPFWIGEAPARTPELSEAVAELRNQVAVRLSDTAAAADWLVAETGLDRAGADQLVAYVAETRAALGCVPTQQRVIAERFFDESGGMQLVLHAPFGGRVNRAWGLALRKRFCLSFDFELQAAATDDGIVISLGEQHSFPLESVFAMVRSATLEPDLVQAVLAAPVFGTRWRWNATRALALLRHSGGRRVPMPIQRMRAEDLLAAIFPAQLACGDNHPAGPIEVPDHPLVKETLSNCLHEAMDVEGLKTIIGAIEAGRVETVAVETATPSPMSHEILNANPYAYLDDAPLEERRARAVALRRIDPDLAGGIGALDQTAVEEVRRQAWPDVRDADELHDLLLSLIVLPTRLLAPDPTLVSGVVVARRPSKDDGKEVPSLAHLLSAGEGEGEGDSAADIFEGAADGERTDWPSFAADLVAEARAMWLPHEGQTVLAATERAALARLVLDEHAGVAQGDPEDAARRCVQGWMEHLGPVTHERLAELVGITPNRVDAALLRLESEGMVLRGHFTTASAARHAGAPGHLEWCDRRLLARIHRLTIGRLRREVESVAPADFIRFLLRWQHLHPGTQLHGKPGVAEVIGQLQGLELPAPAWEGEVLPARVQQYAPADLEQLCLAGEVGWGRLHTPEGGDDDGGERVRRKSGPTRSAPLAFFLREALPALLQPAPQVEPATLLSALAREILAHLRRYGAAFLPDIARTLGCLVSQAEQALWELVARGLVTGDGIAGLRTLLLPEHKRRQPRRRLRGLPGGAAGQRLPVGRWSLLRDGARVIPPAEADEFFARQLLRRYGVVLRELLAREVRAPSWRVLLGVYRRLEARGEIRGGRFVAGLVGEQFALPEAVDLLRAVRRSRGTAEVAVLSAADPLNLVGILTPGARVSPFSNQVIAYRDGVPVEIGERGAVASALQPVPQGAHPLGR